MRSMHVHPSHASAQPSGPSSQLVRSWLCHPKSRSDVHPSRMRFVTTSRACTSMTTSADSVARSSFERSPRTRLTMFMSCSVHLDSCSLSTSSPPLHAFVVSIVQ